MEIGQLRNQLTGLEDAIVIIAQTLARQKRIGFNPNDIQILVEAFERGSFRDRVKVVLKSLKNLNQYQGAIALGVLLIEIIRMIPSYQAATIKEMSPQTISKIGDQVKIELLKNNDFLKSITNVVHPLGQNGDRLQCTVPSLEPVAIKYEDKKEFLELAGETEVERDMDGDRSEILRGRINRVDLDATKRHLGFKVNSEGNSIPATLDDRLRASLDMRSLLGQWVEINTTTTFKGGLRDNIFINSLKIVRQQTIDFESRE